MNRFSLTRRTFFLASILCLACLLALLLLAPRAQAGIQAFSLPWWTADSGGKSTGANYILYSAIGQPDAGNLSGGSFKLTGGFLSFPLGPPTANKMFLPVTFKS